MRRQKADLTLFKTKLKEWSQDGVSKMQTNACGSWCVDVRERERTKDQRSRCTISSFFACVRLEDVCLFVCLGERDGTCFDLKNDPNLIRWNSTIFLLKNYFFKDYISTLTHCRWAHKMLGLNWHSGANHFVLFLKRHSCTLNV